MWIPSCIASAKKPLIHRTTHHTTSRIQHEYFPFLPFLPCLPPHHTTVGTADAGSVLTRSVLAKTVMKIVVVGRSDSGGSSKSTRSFGGVGSSLSSTQNTTGTARDRPGLGRDRRRSRGGRKLSGHWTESRAVAPFLDEGAVAVWFISRATSVDFCHCVVGDAPGGVVGQCRPALQLGFSLGPDDVFHQYARAR